MRNGKQGLFAYGGAGKTLLRVGLSLNVWTGAWIMLPASGVAGTVLSERKASPSGPNTHVSALPTTSCKVYGPAHHRRQAVYGKAIIKYGRQRASASVSYHVGELRQA